MLPKSGGKRLVDCAADVEQSITAAEYVAPAYLVEAVIFPVVVGSHAAVVETLNLPRSKRPLPRNQ
jgi:hypothetical protein